jgi:mono/diheme cytochrome c family protein
MKSKNNKYTTKTTLLINYPNFKIMNWLIVSFIFVTLCITNQQALAVRLVPDAVKDDIPAEVDRPIAEVITEFQSSPETMETSELMFNQNCAYCHGNQGGGGKSRKMQCLRFLNNEYVYKTISNGKRSGSLIMPSWSKSFDKTKRLMLTAYVMTLKTLPKCSK